MAQLKRFMACIALSAFAVTALAQSQVFTSDKVDYSIELPTSTWRVIAEPDAAHQHVEFVYGDRLEGYLEIRKEALETGGTLEDVVRQDQEQRLRYLPGFVEGKGEHFAGRLNGMTSSYEYVKNGKPMMGRIYYLQADNRTIYALRFSALRDKLLRIRNQTDAIARSFKLK